jgi:glutaconyl-CoA decarboxylase
LGTNRYGGILKRTRKGWQRFPEAGFSKILSLGAADTMKTFEITVGGKDYKIDIKKFDGRQALVNVNGTSYEVDVKKAAEAAISAHKPPSPVSVPRPAAPTPPEPTLAPVTSAPTGGQVVAPMPGLILEVLVSVGDTVAAGTAVVKIEAMKMENEIPAPSSGTVKEILVKKGDRVATDEVLMAIEEG